MATENVQGAQQTFEGVSNSAQQLTAEIVAVLPQVIAAIIILVVGWIVGRFLGGLVARAADRIGVDRSLSGNPIGRALGGTEQSIARSLGAIAKWFVYLLAILAAADVLAIPTLSEWISSAISYLPAFIGGLLIILIGFVVSDFVADAIRQTEAATRYNYTSLFADAVRIFLYFIVIVVGLDTMGVDVQILYTFARALSWGLAIGIGAAIAIAFGWGGKDYVRQNIGDWMNQARDEMQK